MTTTALTISEVQRQLQRGENNARSITEMYLDRIKQLNKQGPAVNAVLEINPDALSIAEQLDNEYKTQGARGPLHGVPILVKDNLDSADRMQTTAGSLALQGSIATQDSFVIAKLRAAGAVILGKTNLSEWANFRSTRSSSGWSSRGGQTRNPYALDRTPGGSSSGSGVAVASEFCVAAIGTETDGSISNPASFNSIVGIKPTVGLISRSGIIPIAHSQDTAGPMARTVRDAATILGALTGIDAQDPATEISRDNVYDDYTQFLDKDGLRGARIGIARDFFEIHEKVNELISICIQSLKEAGADVIDPVSIKTAAAIREPETIVMAYEFKADLNAYLAQLPDPTRVRSLQDVIDFNLAQRDRVMPYFAQERMDSAQAKGSLDDPEYQNALQLSRRLAREQGIDATLKEHNLDAIATPTTGLPWLIDLVNGDHRTGGCSGPAAVAGYPHITVPAGYVYGLPVGLSFFASTWQEPTLIRLAYAFEQAAQARRPPSF